MSLGPRVRARHGRVIGVALASVLLLGPVGAVAAPVVAGVVPPAGGKLDARASTVRYVALGDSAAAGPVIVPQQDGPEVCQRSRRNFPTLAAASLSGGGAAVSLVDVTCSSAMIDDLTRSQASGVPPQLDALRADTTLVTLGPIGANDTGLVSTVQSCLMPGCRERDGQRVHRAIEATRPELAAALVAIRQRAPVADIVVVGYGRYFPSGACPSVQPFTASDGNYIQELIDHSDDVLRDAAAAGGASFVDLRAIPTAREHTACAPAGSRWLEGQDPASGDGASPYHPTALGMTAFAGAVVAGASAALEEPGTAVPSIPTSGQPGQGPGQPGQGPGQPGADGGATARQLRLTARCRTGGSVLLRVGGRTGPVRRVVFRLGPTWVGADRSGPYRLVVPARRLRAFDGRVRAVVRLGPDAMTARLTRPRPACSPGG